MSDLLKTGLNALQNQLPGVFGISVGGNAPTPDLNTAAQNLDQALSAVKVPKFDDPSKVFDSEDLQSVNIARFAAVQHGYGTLTVEDCLQDEGAKEVLALARTMAEPSVKDKILGAFDSDGGLAPDLLDRHHTIVAYVVHQAASGITETAQSDVNIEPQAAFRVLDNIRGAQNALLEALESRGVETGLSPAQPIAARYLNEVKLIWRAGEGTPALTASAA
ncbi:MAG: hypothetical protein R3E13_07510 [Alphaproteobacteria bacterium]